MSSATAPAALMDRDAARVVAAVLEPAQAFDEDGHDVAAADRGDDSTHGDGSGDGVGRTVEGAV